MEERFLSSETEEAYIDGATVIDKALVFSKDHPPPKSLLYFLENCCKNLEIVLKTSRLQVVDLLASSLNCSACEQLQAVVQN